MLIHTFMPDFFFLIDDLNYAVSYDPVAAAFFDSFVMTRYYYSSSHIPLQTFLAITGSCFSVRLFILILY